MASKLAWPVNDKQLNKETNLVGAAGFEPTTCSTQNCRATRLRYTPNVRRAPSIHASQSASKPSKGASKLPKRPPGRGNNPSRLLAAEQRVTHAVAGADAIFLRRACHHLQNSPRGPPG